MPPVVADVTRAVCMCLLDTTMNCVKTYELIEIPSGGVWISVGPKKHVLRGGQILPGEWTILSTSPDLPCCKGGQL